MKIRPKHSNYQHLHGAHPYPRFLLGGRAGPASPSTLLETCDSREELEAALRHSDWYWGGRGSRPLSASRAP